MMNLADFWPQCLLLLQSDLSEQQFRSHIAPLTVGEENGTWIVYAKNQFAANLLRSQYLRRINEARDLIGENLPEIVVKVGNSTHYEVAPAPAPQAQNTKTATEHPIEHAPAAPLFDSQTENTSTPPSSKPAGTSKTPRSPQDIVLARLQSIEQNKSAAANQPKQTAPSASPAPKTESAPSAVQLRAQQDEAKQRFAQTNLNPDNTFANLVEGKGNQLAATVAQTIADEPGKSMYNPFFVYGSTGLGKTHLVQAVGNRLIELRPSARVHYMHADEYIQTFMTTVRNKTWDSFKHKYNHYDLLIIDDIQFIAGKDRTMEEFFHLFEHFHSNKQQIILTCDQLPSSLEAMDARLISRFSWGMTIKIDPPELEMRIEILERKAQAAGLALNEDAALFIAQNIKQNVRELEGALNRVVARCLFEKRKVIDFDLANDALQDIIISNYKPITTEIIMKEVADFYKIKVSDLLGKKRNRAIARPRQIAMSLTKELMPKLSLPAIGDAFGGKDHTTVMHAVKNVKQLRESEADVAMDYEKLLIIIRN